MKNSNRNELPDVLKQLKEHLSYFGELGIEFVEPIVVNKITTGKVPIQPPFTSKAISTPSISVRTSPPTDKPSPTTKSATSSSGLFSDLEAAAEKLNRSPETFEDIHSEIGACTRCPLHAGRKNVVHTEGNRRARLMFVGEAPGADEDIQARPFVGRAGQLLTKIIEAIGFKRDEVLIGNVNRCRPPGNRPPTAEEATICRPFLLREIASAQPDVIVVLGNTATHNLLETKEGISKLRGRFHNYKGVPVMPTFHPAYLLRDPSKKRETWEDLKKVRDFLDSKKPGEQMN